MTDPKNDEQAVNPHTGMPVPPEGAAYAQQPLRRAAAPASGAGPGGSAPASGSGGDDSTAGGTPAAGAGGEKPAPSQQEMAIRAALESVMDPEIGLSVIDLGLIREVHVFPDRTHVKMMLTTPFCPYAPQMMEEVKQATMGAVPLPCEVELMPDAWSPDLMPDPGLLGFSF